MFEYQEKPYSVWGGFVLAALLIGWIFYKDAQKPVEHPRVIEAGKNYYVQVTEGRAPNVLLERILDGFPVSDIRYVAIPAGEVVKVIEGPRDSLSLRGRAPHWRVQLLSDGNQPPAWVMEDSLLDAGNRKWKN